MIRKAFIVTVVSGLLSINGAHAEAHRLSPMKAGTFLRLCSDTRSRALCDAYLAGVADGGALTFLSSRHQTGGGVAAFCVPDTETTMQMRASVVKWLQNRRAIFNGPVGKAVVAALHDAYPCRDTEAAQ